MKKAKSLDVGVAVLEIFSISKDRKCPHCGRKMMRVPRKGWQRLMSKAVPLTKLTRWECCGDSWIVIR